LQYCPYLVFLTPPTLVSHFSRRPYQMSTNGFFLSKFVATKIFCFFYFNRLTGNQPLKSPFFLRQIKRIYEKYFLINKFKMLFFARLCQSITTYQPIIIKNTYMSIAINKKNELTEIRTYGLPVKIIISRFTRKTNEKFWSPQIYLATHSRKPFGDIWYGLREK
jgi:hypothetical protein